MRIRALAACLLAVALVGPGAGRDARAQSAPSTMDQMNEAERLDKESRALAAQKKWIEAGNALGKAIKIQIKLAQPLAPVVQKQLLGPVSDDCVRLAQYRIEAQAWKEAADALEVAITLSESVGGDAAKKVPKLKEALAEVRKKAGTAAPEPKAPVDEKMQLFAMFATIQTLYENGDVPEAAMLADAMLPQVDGNPKVDPMMAAAANFVGGRVYAESHQITKAETRLKKSLDLMEKASGKTSGALFDPLKALGDFYLDTQEPERAVPYYARAYDIAKAQNLPAAKLALATIGLANVLSERDDHAEAATVMDRARQIWLQESGGKKSFNYLLTTVMLARIEQERGRFAESERLFEEVRAELEPQYRAAPKETAAIWASFLALYAWHHRLRENWSRAEQLQTEAMGLLQQVFPANSPVIANQGCNLGEIHWASGNLSRSLDPIQRCFDSRDEELTRILATGSEEQKRAILSNYLVAYQKTLTAQMLAGTTNPKMTRLALGQVFRTKGRVLDAMSGESAALRRGATAETKQLMDKLAATRTLLAEAAQAGRDVARIKQLEEEARGIEQQLSQKSEAFRAATRSVDVDAVRAAIPKDHVLVEIVAFEPLDPKYRRIADRGAFRYMAYVVHGSGGPEPVAIDLGPAAPIDADATALRAALRDPDRDATGPARSLYDRVMRPLEVHFGDKTRVILSPDGALNTVPFAALRKGDDWLVTRYGFSYVTSGRDLLRWGSAKPKNDAFVVVANPEFAMNGTSAASGSRFAGVKFPPLPGTESEAGAIRGLFKNATVLTQRSATESAVKKLEHPQILHLATHGFFLKDKPLQTTGTRSLELDAGEVKKSALHAESPLLRSGLALAGAAALKGNDGEDGILTALEASSLDLVGTRLVVLSACQTAEGETQNGEGVYGLRRALAVAGAETLVMSLWSVDDEATSYLMRRYYARLKEGAGRADALREVQSSMARSKGASHPYFWAAFIPSGETGAMEFPRDVPAPSSSSSYVPPPPPPPTKDSGSDLFEDVGRGYDFTFVNGSFGVASLSLKPLAGVTTITNADGVVQPASTQDGTALHFGFDANLISAFVPEIGIDSRGLSFYDRASITISAVNMGGSDVTANQLDYTAMLGVRSRWIGLFAGAMIGTGGISLDDTFESTGPFIPAAGRVELPWWWESRLTANAFAFKLGGVRSEVVGVDARMPLLTKNLWFGVTYLQTKGRSDQVAEGSMTAFSLGIGEGRRD